MSNEHSTEKARLSEEQKRVLSDLLNSREMVAAVARAAAKPRLGRYDWFRYFAGVCWSMLTEIEADAARIVRKDGD